MKLSAIIPAILGVFLVACGADPLDLSGNRPVICEEVRDEVLEIAEAQAMYDLSDSHSDDPEVALEEVWALVAQHGYVVLQKPDGLGPLSRFTQTTPYGAIFLAGNWASRSLVDRLAIAEHELLHMLLELSMPKDEFMDLYLGDAVFRAGIELAAYKVSYKVARKHGRSAEWEKRNRRQRVGSLFHDYLLGLAMTRDCLTELSEAVWGPIERPPPGYRAAQGP